MVVMIFDKYVYCVDGTAAGKVLIKYPDFLFSFKWISNVNL